MKKKIELFQTTDILLVPVYLFIFLAVFYFVFYKYRNTTFGFFLWCAFLLKMFFSLLRIAISLAVYGGGDTYHYYEGSTRIYRAFFENPVIGIELIVKNLEDYSFFAVQYAQNSWLYRDSSVSLITKVGGFISLFSFGSYPVISLICSSAAFIGNWMICKSFIKIFPKARFYILSALFIPSVVYWGALLSKDSIAMFSLGIVHYYMFEVFYHKRYKVLYFITISAFSFLLFSVKSYILFIYLASFAIAFIFLLEIPIRENWVKRGIKLAGLASIIGGAFFVILSMQNSTSNVGKLDPETISEISENVMTGVELGGSPYTIYGFNWSPTGLMIGSVGALNVTYFRPYLWETKKPILLPSAVESVFVLLFSIFIFYKARIISRWNYYFKGNKPLFFCLVFCIFFGVVTGLFSFTFGTLVRYKIPCMMFYIILLAIIYSEYKERKKIIYNHK